jgi:hypothetical protein
MNRTYTHSEPETDIRKKNIFHRQSEIIPLILISLIGIAGLITSFLLYT